MAFIHVAIRLFKKLQRWVDRNNQDSPPGQPPPTDQTHQAWGLPLSDPGPQANNQKNAQDPRFAGLRNDALKEQKLMEQKFEKARGASQREQAQSLREEANRHKERRDHLNNKAAEWLYKENNKDLPSDTIDLHGLYVKEALTYAEKFIEKAQKKGRPDRLNFIVGRGLHSVNSKPQVKPAIEELVRKHQLAFEIHPRNPGIIVVHLNVPGHQLDRGVNLLDRILCNPNPKDGCVIV
ncbi:hypothetical protein PGT21_017845 [Puccinia graminis f. sp. tritici]|uniref:Smr domain-containing protein n=1 Tax=Puccinia graminis f. sp. tritici TaxID=56615 RepID=A0A5B0RJR8_PUCGR|nr:hypothetical protein PGT21_017845 [Puccinia graminis f. sp. tritici]KAA1126060.1 hypothetical protein PGTUg99_019063 [Puccinia graminis f. sp. tritici]